MELFKAKFNPSAQVAIAEATGWYRHISPALVQRLNAEIAAAVLSVRARPFGNGVRYQGVRRRNLDRFPYALFYIVDEPGRVVVFTNFFHVKQNIPYQGVGNPENLINEPETIPGR